MNEYPEKQSSWQIGQRSTACYEREIAKLKKQRDALLEACEEIANWMHKNTEERINLQEKILDIIDKATIAAAKE